ncbi:hypothetical protein ACFUJU_07765 [Streptomyces sp. NPDC057235]|uniref:hypothetical protein n=1 Tax=Streptomyces sp. NPDC057235 TaxID=3346058 RepID=UPI0036406D5E
MTDTAPEQTEDWSDVEQSAAATYPEHPANPHNHRFTISMNGQGPMVVVRGNTAEEIIAASEELREQGVGAVLGSFWTDFTAAVKVASGLGGATPVPAPAGPPAPPQGAPTPPPFGPNVSVPQAAGYAGPPQAPMTPQAPQYGGQPQGGAQNSRGPKPRPAEWPTCFRIEIPYQQKDAFKAYREQYKEAFKGKVFWAGGGGYWVHGDIVQSFAPYNPTPA